jgi:hypothetical protein
MRTGTALKLIKSCLEGRYRKVILDGDIPNCHSEWGEIRQGVPGISTWSIAFLTLHK